MKSGNAASTMPSRCNSSGDGLPSGTLQDFTSTSRSAPMRRASQAARLSEVTSQLSGISGSPVVMAVGLGSSSVRINAVNDVTRQQGDTEWKHFDRLR